MEGFQVDSQTWPGRHTQEEHRWDGRWKRSNHTGSRRQDVFHFLLFAPHPRSLLSGPLFRNVFSFSTIT
ncbi:hypothetical protein EYF80_015224 [Liparis tanakae]|uniref:Uncharacterized protein n=1 Tax=Liparis tanakae TaxID=230148 RepID=A0A4Z2IAV9_9TELE|nr:hypothetical protein EYF80_015224 [Liparis tanakae]